MKSYLNDLKEKVSTWDAQIKELELAAIHATDPKEVEEDKRQVAELRARRDELDDRIREIEKVSGESWNDGIMAPLQDLVKGIESKLDHLFRKKKTA